MPPITTPRRSTIHANPFHSHAHVQTHSQAQNHGRHSTSTPSSPTLGSPLASLAAAAASSAPVSTMTTTTAMSRPTPYMVALAGWPEPVFVAEARDTWEKRRSRPSTPTPHLGPPLHSGEVRDGISFDSPSSHGGHSGHTSGHPSPAAYAPTRAGGISMTRTASGNVPIDPVLRSRPPSPSPSPSPPFAMHAPSPSAYPTSSARGHSTLPHSGPVASGSSTSSRGLAPLTPIIPRGAHNTSAGYADPRYGPTAAVLPSDSNISNVATGGLRVAPAWSGGGTRATGQRPARSGMLVTHRAVPEVWPPPGASSSSGPDGSSATSPPQPPPMLPPIGLATEVYPRDPDAAWFWPALSPGASPAAVAAAAAAANSPGGITVRKDVIKHEKMEVDE